MSRKLSLEHTNDITIIVKLDRVILLQLVALHHTRISHKLSLEHTNDITIIVKLHRAILLKLAALYFGNGFNTIFMFKM